MDVPKYVLLFLFFGCFPFVVCDSVESFLLKQRLRNRNCSPDVLSKPADTGGG